MAGVLAVAMVATSGRYDYHRDELYFRLLGQHPAWGYVDQPPATPLLARLMTELFGDHLWALRLPGALILAATAILTAMLARDLGGGTGAQVLAAAGGAGAFPLIFGHVLLTATLDLVLMAAILLCLVRALRRDERWWLATGALTGLALYNKHLVVLTLLAIGVGLLLVGPRRDAVVEVAARRGRGGDRGRAAEHHLPDRQRLAAAEDGRGDRGGQGRRVAHPLRAAPARPARHVPGAGLGRRHRHALPRSAAAGRSPSRTRCSVSSCW